MGRRVTAQDVADLAGVSRSSVSVVLNGRAQGNISAAKQQAIIEAARQLNYRANALALSLRSQRTHTLGVLSWRGGPGSPAELLHAAWVSATDAGYLLIMMDTTHDPAHELRAVTTLLDRQVDGFLVVAPELAAYRPLEAMVGTPTVMVNCVDPDRTVTSVIPDEFGAGFTAAEILIERGHRRIGLLTDGAETIQSLDRVAGVRAALLRADLPGPTLLLSGRDARSGAARTREALLAALPPTGLVCTHERLALGAVLAAAELGIDIPGTLSVVSLEDGESLAADLLPALTTVERPDRAMVDQAVRVLVAELNGTTDPDVRQLSFVCPPKLRGSTGPATVLDSAGTP